METFRIDESGYTGYDLLNREQPLQGACAIAIDDDEAQRLIQEHFPKLKAEELKYRSLARRQSNHPRLLALQADILSNFKCVTILCDKKYLLMLMFMNYAVEPWYYERRSNLYARGGDIGMASLLYRVGPAMLGREGLERILASFQHAVKEKTPAAAAKLVQAVRATDWEQLIEILGPLGRDACSECLDAIATPGVSTDAAFVVLQALITRMEVMADGPYRIEHDESKNLKTYHDVLQAMIDHKEEVTFRQSDIASLTFPLKLRSVTQVDSKSSPAVQLADVMVGLSMDAAGAIMRLRPATVDPQAVMARYSTEQIIHMLPITDFAELRRSREGTQAAELIEYIGANFASAFPGARGTKKPPKPGKQA